MKKINLFFQLTFFFFTVIFPSIYHYYDLIRYIRETIHDGDQKAEIGGLIKGDAGKGIYAADLGYHGEEPEDYDDKTYEVKNALGEDDPMEDLIAFIKYIRDYQVDNNADDQTIFNEWDQKINIKHFMRQIAVEWLTGNWDAHQYSKFFMNIFIYYAFES